MSKWLILSIILIAALLVTARYIVLGYVIYRPGLYIGDGILVDHGLFSWPRYELTLATIDLSRDVDYTFYAAGLPTVPMTFRMYPVPTEFKKHVLKDDYLTSLNTVVRVRISDDQGGRLMDEEAALADWPIAKGSDYGFFYGSKTSQIAANGRRRYTVTIQVSKTDYKDLGSLMIVLDGGGFETP